MFTEFNRIYALEIDLKNLETIFNSKALYANTDLNTSAMLIKLSLGETPLDVTDKIVTAYIKTAKDQIVTMQRCEILEASEGVIGLDFKSSALKTGTNTFFLEIKSDNEEIINSPLITYKVVELFDVTGGSDGENNVTILSQIITEIDILKTSVEGLESEIAILRKSIEDLQNIDMVGKEVQLQKSEEYIQWKYADEEEWRNLIALEELKVKGVYVGSKDTAPSTADIIIDNSDEGLLFEEVVPNIQIGEVTTLEPGTKATVSRRGTKENPIFDFGIPKGDNGSNGADGATPNMTEFEKKINEQYEDIITKNTEFKEQMNTDFGNAKTDYFGKEHHNVVDRLNSDFDNVHQRINDSSYLEYSGSSITADNTYYGLTKELSVKGRTLQNLLFDSCADITITQNEDSANYVYLDKDKLIKENTVYSFIINVKSNTLSNTLRLANVTNGIFPPLNLVNANQTGCIILKTTSNINILNKRMTFGVNKGDTVGAINFSFMLLEGDYTNTPLEDIPFGEGIYSVGESEVTEEGKYKISWKSCRKNLAKNRKAMDMQHSTGRYVTSDNGGYANPTSIEYLPKGTYVLSLENYNVANFVDAYIYIWKTDLSIKNWRKVTISKAFEILDGEVGITWYGAVAENENIDKLIDMRVQIEEGTVATEFEPYQESTQELLLDEPLRSLPNGVCDEILEDGTEIRRIGKVVLDGNTKFKFSIHGDWSRGDYLACYTSITDRKTGGIIGICNNFIVTTVEKTIMNGISRKECMWLENYTRAIYLSISKSKLQGVTITDVTKYLNDNPTTVYYELAEPIITKHNVNINLKTFEGTTHITSDNYLQPTITCKVPSNVQATIMNLKEENEELNNTISLMSLENEEIKTVNETQDILIDTTMMATDEMFTMLEPILEMLPQTTNLEREVKNSMVDLYVAMVMRGLKTIEQVPARYREEVREILAQLEK